MTDIAQSGKPKNVFFVYTKAHILNDNKYTKDITKEVIMSLQGTKKETNNGSIKSQHSKKGFIVHGRNHFPKEKVARFIEQLGLSAIILHEQVNAGKTIIEKIEEYTDVGFAIVLYTPCDTGGLLGSNTIRSRARQNVVFEHGYLMGKLSRNKVFSMVYGDDIETPNDISGIVYEKLDDNDGWKFKLVAELERANYEIDRDKI